MVDVEDLLTLLVVLILYSPGKNPDVPVIILCAFDRKRSFFSVEYKLLHFAGTS